MKRSRILMHRTVNVASCAAICAWFASGAVATGQTTGAAELAKRIAAAKPGTTVTLPAGTLRLGDIAIPAGVSLQGAGYAKTILDASGHDVGLICRNTGPTTISDLAVLGPRQTGILVDGGSKITMQRISIRKCMNGLILRQAADCRAERDLGAEPGGRRPHAVPQLLAGQRYPGRQLGNGDDP